MRRTPSASSRPTASSPQTSERAGPGERQRRTARNDEYSSPVNTGAMYIGFHASSDQAPNSALLRALWTHAPSSCQTMPTGGFQGGSAAGKSPRSCAAISRTTSERRRRQSRRQICAARSWRRRPPHPDVKSLRALSRLVCRTQPAREARRAHEEMRRVVHVRVPVALLKRDDGGPVCGADRRAARSTP